MIQTETNKNVLGKKKGYIVKLGAWNKSGKTAKEAKDNLKTNIKWLSEQDFIPIVKWAKDCKTCFMLTCDINGYQYLITDSSRNYPASCLLGQIAQREAIKKMEDHANNY